MDWNPLHSSLFTGAGTAWGAVDTRPTWDLASLLLPGAELKIAYESSEINLDPRFSSAYRDLVFPVVEASTVAGATMLGGLTLGGAAYSYVTQNDVMAQGIDLDPYHSQHFVNVQLPVAKIIAVAAITYYTGGLAAAYLGPAEVGVAGGWGLLTAGQATAAGVAVGAAAGAGAGIAIEAGEDQLTMLDVREGEGWLAENAAAIGVVLGGAWLGYKASGKTEPTLEDVRHLGEELQGTVPVATKPVAAPRPRSISVPALPLSPAADNTLKALALGGALFLASKF